MSLLEYLAKARITHNRDIFNDICNHKLEPLRYKILEQSIIFALKTCVPSVTFLWSTGTTIDNLLRIMETTTKVLETMRSAGKPVSAGEVATLSGLDRKEVDKAFAQLKKDGAIVSPVRCKWQPAE